MLFSQRDNGKHEFYTQSRDVIRQKSSTEGTLFSNSWFEIETH